jgi:hypothetical protein
MMLEENVLLTAYVILGVLTASVTMCVFPPMAGFRPAAILVISAFLVFILLWPVLVSLALWYHTLAYLHQPLEQPVHDVGESSRPVRHLRPTVSQIPVSKPR